MSSWMRRTLITLAIVLFGIPAALVAGKYTWVWALEEIGVIAPAPKAVHSAQVMPPAIPAAPVQQQPAAAASQQQFAPPAQSVVSVQPAPPAMVTVVTDPQPPSTVVVPIASAASPAPSVVEVAPGENLPGAYPCVIKGVSGMCAPKK